MSNEAKVRHGWFSLNRSRNLMMPESFIEVGKDGKTRELRYKPKTGDIYLTPEGKKVLVNLLTDTPERSLFVQDTFYVGPVVTHVRPARDYSLLYDPTRENAGPYDFGLKNWDLERCTTMKPITVLAASTQEDLNSKGSVVEAECLSIKDAKAKALHFTSQEYATAAEMSAPLGYAKVVVNGKVVFEVEK